jgi:hypothetical protein
VLLYANGFDNMRTLAVQVHDPPLYFPMRRLPAEQFAATQEAAQESTPLLDTPLTRLPRLDVGFRGVSDYAQQYAGGLQVKDTT